MSETNHPNHFGRLGTSELGIARERIAELEAENARLRGVLEAVKSIFQNEKEAEKGAAP